MPPYHDIYPPIRAILELINTDKPELQFGELEISLLEAGVISSHQVVLLPEEVLCLIGNMGLERARLLRNYAKRVVLPLLGVLGNYDEPEIASPSPVNKGKERGHTDEGEGTMEDPWWVTDSSTGEGLHDEYVSHEESEDEGVEEI